MLEKLCIISLPKLCICVPCCAVSCHACARVYCTASTKIETKWKHMQHNYNIIDERQKRTVVRVCFTSPFSWEHQAYGAMINLIDSFTAKVQMHKFYFQWCYAALNNDAMRCKAAGVNETNWPMQQNWIICLKCCYIFFGSFSLFLCVCVHDPKVNTSAMPFFDQIIRMWNNGYANNAHIFKCTDSTHTMGPPCF